MKRVKILFMAAILSLAVGAVGGLLEMPAHAQGISRISGLVTDEMGMPYPNVTLVFTNEIQKVFTVKTDAKGTYTLTVPGGTYNIDVKVMDKVIYQTGIKISGSASPVFNIDLKAALGANAAAAAASEAAAKQFAALKAHFDAGLQAIDAMKAAQAQMAQTPKDQQDALKAKIQASGATAVDELNQAIMAMKPDDGNMPIILGHLGEAYEAMGKNQEAADAYQKAITLSPDNAANYNNLGNNLAKLGKVDEARAAYEKYVALQPTDAALAWRNFAVVLYQANRMQEALEPAQKATTLDPKNAQAWYILGSALVATMQFKCAKSGQLSTTGTCPDGDTLAPVIDPATIPAFQQAIALDPNGAIGAQAKQGLEALQAMGVSGIETKVGNAGPPPSAKAPAKGKK